MAKADAVPTGQFTTLVIGSGFGGTMTSLSLAREYQRRGKGETICILERGTWWTTPVSTVQDKNVDTYTFLQKKNQPVQFWPSIDHFRGFVDIVLRCVRRKKNEDGLYELTRFGTRTWWGFGGENDGVSVLRANGVGGGSLVYSNVTIEPPDFVFDDPRWPKGWRTDKALRDRYFSLARDAIGFGVIFAREKAESANPNPALKVNAGLSNIVTRSARLDPHWVTRTDPANPRGIKRINLNPDQGDPAHEDPNNTLWIDRARVFQTAMSKLTKDFGTVDSAINDLPAEPLPLPPGQKPPNHCERQGRCNVGCLPGARHTLNKQLMAAALGKFDGTPPLFQNVSIRALTEVDLIRQLPNGDYEVECRRRNPKKPWKCMRETFRAKDVVVAAGCVGTNEILLRSKAADSLPNLSPAVGKGFSTNGDYLAFLKDTQHIVSLTRGPVTTSFGHFGSSLDAGPGTPRFHTIEDNGIPRALASLVGFGVPLLKSFSRGRHPQWFLLFSLFHRTKKYLVREVLAFFRNASERQDSFRSEDEQLSNMMCIAAMGLEAARGEFRLGTRFHETTLRLKRPGKEKFHEDPIYTDITNTLKKLAKELTGKEGKKFRNPFLSEEADALKAKAITLSHPLGGCRMADTPETGVVDEWGRVFDVSRPSAEPFYKGLYIADASVIPTALGVNPSLTISALALRIADKIIEATAAPPIGSGSNSPGPTGSGGNGR